MKKEFRQVCYNYYFGGCFYVYVWCIFVHRALLQRHDRVSEQKLLCHCTSSRSRPIVDLSHFKGSRVTAPLQKEKEEAILETGSVKTSLFFLRSVRRSSGGGALFFFFFYELL